MNKNGEGYVDPTRVLRLGIFVEKNIKEKRIGFQLSAISYRL